MNQEFILESDDTGDDEEHSLFICDAADVFLKDVIQWLEFPFYSLTKKPVTTPTRYDHKGNWIQITPSVVGMATIYDKDILIFCISQIISAMKRGEKVSKRVRFNCSDLLKFANRGCHGGAYDALENSIARLNGTVISTNIVNPADETEEQYKTFSLIHEGSVIRNKGRRSICEIVLSDWVFNSIKLKGVLTLHPDYFKLDKPVERRVYELARKHCGQKIHDDMFIETLYSKSGSIAELKEFRRSIKGIAERNQLPDYEVVFDEESDKVYFTNRKTMPIDDDLLWDGPLSPGVFEKVESMGIDMDKYILEQEFRKWVGRSRIKVINGSGLFLDFCRKRKAQLPKTR